jgi:hypothetical protein
LFCDIHGCVCLVQGLTSPVYWFVVPIGLWVRGDNVRQIRCRFLGGTV